MRRSWRRVLLIGLGLPLLLGLCVLLSFFPRSPLGPGILPVTPEAAARANSPCGSLNPLQSFRVLDTVPTPRGKLVTFHTACFLPLGGGRGDSLGYSYMEREEDGVYWSDNGGGGYGGGWDPGGGGLVLVDLGSTEDQNGNSEAIVYGYALSPRVRAIEAVFGDGQKLREDVGGDGAFTLRALGVKYACKVHVLGADGRVLDTFAAAPNDLCS